MIKGRILDTYIIRHKQRQKHDFLRYAKNEFEMFGYSTEIQKNRVLGIPNYNLIIGDINEADIILTAHYDTPNTIIGGVKMYANSTIKSLLSQLKIVVLAFLPLLFFNRINEVWFLQILALGIIVLTTLTFTNKNNYNDNTSGILTIYNIAEKLKESKESKIAFVLFDNEEKGLLGSLGFARKYKKILKNKLIINFDCVGNGEYILLGTNKKNLYIAEEICNNNKTEVITEAYIKKNPLTMSDDTNFRKSIQVMAFTKRKNELVLDYIHTNRDKCLSEENIDCITNMIVNYVEQRIVSITA